jgi:hypothetical protein
MSYLKDFVINKQRDLKEEQILKLKQGNTEDAYNIQGKIDVLKQIQEICENRGRF